ncbi:YcbJ family phosphotransferase [Ewingella sp. S1.OA.A_B6]
MELLKAELSIVLGEHLSRLECVSEQPYAHLFALYDEQGHAMPLMAKSFTCAGIAAQEAYKLSIMAREASVKVPTVFGMVTTQQSPYQEILLIERLRGVSAEAPARTRQSWEVLKDQIVEGLLAWHRIDSHGCVGTVDSTQENNWAAWYQQRVEVLWVAVSNLHSAPLTADDRTLLFRSRACLPSLFADFNDNAVLVHGNLSLRSLLKDPRSDQLLAMINPGTLLWAPREFDLFGLWEPGMSEELLFRYLQRAPVAENFLARRGLYMVWESMANMIHTGKFDRRAFDYARQQLLPWLN